VKRILWSAPRTVGALAVLILAGLAIRSNPATAEGAKALPAPAVDAPPGQATSAVVVLAGGCFWGVQGVFQHVKGVTSAVSGYHQDFLTRNPTYPYIAINDLPKIEDLKRVLPDLYRAAPVLVAGGHSSR
jgi:peptide methionine sulfoxide reductase